MHPKYYLKYYRGYAPDAIILETRSDIKVTVTPKWDATLQHPKMYPHSNFEFPTLKNIGDMLWTRLF